MDTRWIKSVVIVLVCAGSLQAQMRQGLVERRTLLEAIQQIPDWKDWEPSTPTDYNATQLDALGPALAGTVKLYGTKGVMLQQWTSAQGKVLSTFFEMLDSSAAYGLFTSQRNATAKSTPILIGADSFQSGGSLYFWQSNYVVKIEGRPGPQDALARLVSERITGSSQKPTVAEHLPPSQLVAGSEKYLLNGESMDRSVGVSPDQIGFDESAEAATARYSSHGSTAQLLLMLYPTHHLARKYAEQIAASATMSPEFLKRDGPLLAIVYDSTDQGLAKSILDGVNHEYNVVFNESNEIATYAQMILTTFKLIGLFLLASLVAGVTFGGVRLFVKKRFPNQVFDRAQDTEIIQLKLDQSVTEKALNDQKYLN